MSMTRQECEEKIVGLLWEIAKVVEEYNPDNNYLSLVIWAKDEVPSVAGCNAHFKAENKDGSATNPIDFYAPLGEFHSI